MIESLPLRNEEIGCEKKKEEIKYRTSVSVGLSVRKCNLSSSSRREKKRKVVQTMINKLYCGSFNKHT